MIVTALCVVTGRPLLAENPHAPGPYRTVHKSGPVWIYNLEDPAEEMDRRIAAALIHHRIACPAINQQFYIDSGRDRALTIAVRIAGAVVLSPVGDALVAELKARGVLLLVVDPFVQSHEAEENRNDEMNVVMSAWAAVAHEADCAILLVHHFRKGGAAGDGEAFRGAGAIHGAARAMATLATMTAEEAAKLGVDEMERWQFFRKDNAKANMARRPEDAEWYQLVSVELGNGTPEYPEGDSVQTVQAWSPPSVWEGMPWSVVISILDHLEEGLPDGEKYAQTSASGDRWAGKVIIDAAGSTEKQAGDIVRAWVKSGLLMPDVYKSKARGSRETKCVVVDAVKLTEMRRNLGTKNDAD